MKLQGAIMTKPCVCVTGSTQGIGFAIAEAFAKTGARLVINSHEPNSTSVRALAELTECHFVQADLSSAEGATSFVEQAYQKLGSLDTLVNNAGIFNDSDFGTLDETLFDSAFNLNVKGYLFAAQAFCAKVRADQDGASIICIGSTNSVSAERNSVIYDSTKGAILMMVRSLAVSLADRGIRVNGVGPGIIQTPLTQPGLDKGETRAVLTRQIPLGRIGKPEDVGGAAVFLASPEARYITGQMLYVDGGIIARQISWDEPV